MATIFNELLYRPMLNTLVLLYENVTFGNLGLSIIILTLLIRIVLFPLFFKTAKHQRISQELQPHIKKIQDTHKEDKATQTKALMDLYKKHNINPFTPIFLLILQIPILYALFVVFSQSFGDTALSEKALSALYNFVPIPDHINFTFLSLDLKVKSLILVLIATAAQFIQGKVSLIKPKKSLENKTLSQAEAIGRQMIFIGPLLTFVLLWNLPAAIGLYWLSTTVFSIIQQIMLNRHMDKKHAHIVS